MNRAMKQSKALNKKSTPQKAQKRTKMTKVAKKTVKHAAPVKVQQRSFMNTSAPTFQQQQKQRHMMMTTSSLPKSAMTSSVRSFRSTARQFSEPAPTAPAAIDDVSPKVQQIVKDILQLNILESLQLTKALKKEFGYSDAAFAMAAPVAAAGGAAAAAAVEEEKPKAAAKTNFNIKLESFDAASKVKIIKEVRTITGLGLKEAKDLVDGAPQILKKEVKKEEAEAIVKLLKDVGAVCILE